MRIGNWVEEKFDKESPPISDSLLVRAPVCPLAARMLSPPAHRCSPLLCHLHWLTPQNFMKMQESRDIAAAIRNPSNGVVVGAVPPMAVEPKQGVHNAMLFSHGPEMGLDFKATMTALHFTDPLKRDPDMVNSNDRVHKSFFYGSKHIDFIVPKVAPHPRLELMSSKKGIWNEQMTQPLPVRLDMYETTNKAFGY